jgi:hypothetical protein
VAVLRDDARQAEHHATSSAWHVVPDRDSTSTSHSSSSFPTGTADVASVSDSAVVQHAPRAPAAAAVAAHDAAAAATVVSPASPPAAVTPPPAAAAAACDQETATTVSSAAVTPPPVQQHGTLLTQVRKRAPLKASCSS